jgi:hypothetical protein
MGLWEEFDGLRNETQPFCIFHISFDNKQKILPVYIQFIVTNHKTISDTGMYPQLISNLLFKYCYTSKILFSVEVNIADCSLTSSKQYFSHINCSLTSNKQYFSHIHNDKKLKNTIV